MKAWGGGGNGSDPIIPVFQGPQSFNHTHGVVSTVGYSEDLTFSRIQNKFQCFPASLRRGKKQLVSHEAERVSYCRSQIAPEASGNIASLSAVNCYGQKTPPNVSFHPAVTAMSLLDLGVKPVP